MIQLFIAVVLVTQETVAHQAPLSMEFSRQQYWSGWPFVCVCVYIYRFTYMYISFQIHFPYRLLQESVYSTVCYTVGFYCLSILHILLHIFSSQTPYLSLSFFPLW